MKVLFIGAATSNHTVRWVNALSKNGHQVLLVSRNDQRDSVNHISKSVQIVYLRFGGGIGYYLNVPQLRRIYLEFKPDIVNVHYATGYATLSRMARCRPLIVSVWGSDVYDFPYKNRRNLRLLRKNLLYCDSVASTSIAMAVQSKRIAPQLRNDVTVTPFGVDVAKFAPVKHCNKDIITIGIVKYLEPIYDIPLLLNAFYLTKKNRSNIKLSIYGGGSLKEDLVKMCEQLGIMDDVSFFGTIPNYEIPNALSTMDIFVNCSKQESFGVAIVEAMAAGLPVVATDCEGFKEVVSNGETGIILHDRTPESMSNALVSLIDDVKLRSKMGSAGREKVQKYYNWDDNVQNMEKLYLKTSAEYFNSGKKD